MPQVVDQLLEDAVMEFIVAVAEAVLLGNPFLSDAIYVQNWLLLPVIFKFHWKIAVLPGARVLTLGGLAVVLGVQLAVDGEGLDVHLEICGTRLVNVLD